MIGIAVEQGGHFLLDRARIGSSEHFLQASPLGSLRCGHAAAAAALALGEAVDKVAALAGQHMEVRGPVLAVLEALEAVENERFSDLPSGVALVVKQQAMAPQASGLAEDGLGGDSLGTGDLPVGAAGEELVKQRGQQVGPFEPVVRAKGLGAEVSTASVTTITLDALWEGLAGVEPTAHIAP